MKKLLSFFLVFTLLIGTIVPLCSCNVFKNSDNKSNNDVTRAEWIEMLASSFGMSEYHAANSYFEDVLTTDPYYSYVQSSYEWGILSHDEKTFSPSASASKEFIVSTAVMASEADYGEDIISFAVKTKIISSTDNLNDGLSYKECEDVLQTARGLYLDKQIAPFENIKMNDSIINYTQASSDQIVSNENTTVLYDGLGQDLKAGDIFIVPGDTENPDGIAKKIASVETDNGQTTVNTMEPALSDLYESFEFASIAVPSEEDIKTTTEGVTLEKYELSPTSNDLDNGAEVEFLGKAGGTDNKVTETSNGSSFSFKIDISKDQVSINPEYGILSQTTTLGEEPAPFYEKDGIEVHKYSSGCKIEGEVAVKNFYIETQFSGNPLFYKQKVHYDVESSIKFVGTLSGDLKKLELGKITVPICTGVWAYLTLELELDANGEYQIKSTISNTTTTEYSENAGIKKVSDQESVNSAVLKGDVIAFVGPKLSLCTFGIVIADLYLKVGIEADASWIGYTNNEYCIDVNIYFPLVELEFCMSDKSILGKLKIGFTFKFLSKENTPLTTELHYESGIGWVDKCTRDADTDKSISSQSDENGGTSASSDSAPEEIQANWEDKYASVLDKYKTCVLEYSAKIEAQEPLDFESYGDPFSTLSYIYPTQNPFDDFCYAFRDMNNDGTPELFLANRNTQLIFAVYTQVDGSPVLLDSFFERSCCLLDASEYIYRKSSAGAADSWTEIYRIADDGKSLELIKTVGIESTDESYTTLEEPRYYIIADGEKSIVSYEEANKVWAECPSSIDSFGLVYIPIITSSEIPSATASKNADSDVKTLTGSFNGVEWGDFMHVNIIGDDGVEYSFFVVQSLDIDIESIPLGQAVEISWQNIDTDLGEPYGIQNIDLLIDIELK